MANLKKKNKKGLFGPGFLVTAAFIGPGTVTTCSLAGARFGYSLLYTLLFAILATILLKEMTGRLSLGSGRDLAQALREFPQNNLTRWFFIILTLSSITLGCAAYEAGNIVGGALGLKMITPLPQKLWVIIIALAAFFILSRKKYQLIETILISLVFVMSLSFVLTLILIRPDFSRIFQGYLPSVPGGSLPLILALIGTTIVPYNLFLHSAAVRKKWSSPSDLGRVKRDLIVSISLGGLISSAIVITSAVAFYDQGLPLESGAQMAWQLKPLFGSFAQILFGLGFFAAGMTSAITAPYAAAFASTGVLGLDPARKPGAFRAVWMLVLGVGLITSLFNLKPIGVIVFAQMANGLILPVATITLLVVLNKAPYMGSLKNTLLQNIIGGLIALLVTMLGLWNIIRLFL
jgi:Mn2+/Fe2+ NRAMP family transporter